MKDTLFYLIKILSKTTRPVVAKIVQEQGCDVKPPRPLGYIVGCLYIRPNRDPRQKVSIVLAYVDYDDARDYQLGI